MLYLLTSLQAMPSNTPETPPDVDLRLIDMIAGIRSDIQHILRPDQRITPSAGDVTLCLGTLGKVAGATWRLSEAQRIRADTKYVLAEVEKIKAETEKIRAQKN